MKYFLFFLFFYFGLISNIYPKCNIKSDCPGKSFPYAFCVNGGINYHCSENPNNESNPPIKWNGTPCYEPNTFKIVYHSVVTGSNKVDFSTPDDNGVYGYYDDSQGVTTYDAHTNEKITGQKGDPIYDPFYEIITITENQPWNETIYVSAAGGTVIFDYINVLKCITQALTNWTNCCSGTNCQLNSNNEQNCCIKILWTSDESDFTSLAYNPSTVPYASNFDAQPGTCQFDCSSRIIYLNQTSSFLNDNGDNNPDNYLHFVSTENDYRNGFFSLTSEMMQAFGHQLGFAYQWYSSLQCSHSGSIMYTEGTDCPTFQNPNWQLNDDDKCMYQKLYCNFDIDAVNETLDNKEVIKLFPNPSNTNILNLLISNIDNKSINYEVNSIIGDIIIKGSILPDENSKLLNLDKLPSGIYFVRLIINDHYEVTKFVIDK